MKRARIAPLFGSKLKHERYSVPIPNQSDHKQYHNFDFFALKKRAVLLRLFNKLYCVGIYIHHGPDSNAPHRGVGWTHAGRVVRDFSARPDSSAESHKKTRKRKSWPE